MIVRLASEQDAAGFIVLAGHVEHWFGPMVGDPGFRAVIDKYVRRTTALLAVGPGETDLVGGLLFSAKPRPIGWQWLVVSEHAHRQGVGSALMTEVTRRFPPAPP
jgi:GNAT superfamily N-acetyltransferase